MSKNNVMVFGEMRPPVAGHYGQTPLRGKHVNKLIEMADGETQDANGYRITREQVVANYTDDARLKDGNWNNRHHVTASGFNGKNTKYYKVSYFHFHKLLNKFFVPYSNISIKSSRISKVLC